MIQQKSISSNDKFLGQFMTPIHICHDIIKNLSNIKQDSIFIEPSFGTGNFINSLLKNNIPFTNIVGVEVDKKLYNESNLNGKNINNINFYDFKINTNEYLHFIGNVPFRTPALSLKTHNSEIKRLCKKYKVSGIREEAIFFILKTIELIELSNNGGRISYIIPKSILTSNSKFYKTFHRILEQKFNIIQIKDLPKNIFENASLDTCLIDLEYNSKTISSFLKTNDSDYWNFNQIFNRTYLGSVPCESIFLSAPNENKFEFQNRLIRLFTEYPNNIEVNLKHNNLAHLKVLNGSNKILIDKKIGIISNYIQEILGKIPNFTYFLEDDNFYKEINHRKEKRYYYRNPMLKKMSFVYEINSNPTKSFYFTGNPSSSSTDYFGFCDYDITRNSSPGACRTIPIENLEQNLTQEFKIWWKSNIGEDYNKIFSIFENTFKSKWYKDMKKKYKRFYFGIPKDISLIER